MDVDHRPLPWHSRSVFTLLDALNPLPQARLAMFPKFCPEAVYAPFSTDGKLLPEQSKETCINFTRGVFVVTHVFNGVNIKTGMTHDGIYIQISRGKYIIQTNLIYVACTQKPSAVTCRKGICVSEISLAVTRQNRSSGFPTRSDTNRAVQPQRMTRRLKFRI